MPDSDPNGFPVSLDIALNKILSVEELDSLLRSIIAKFKMCQQSSEKFREVYPKWQTIRKKNTEELDQIVEALESTKFTCNVVKIVGSSTSALGSIAGIVGAVLIPFSFGFSTPLIVGGIATGILGGSASTGTDITEWCLLKNRTQEASKILKSDENEFQCMREWFEHTDAFIEEVEKIFDFEILSKIVCAGKEDFFYDSEGFASKISSFPNARPDFIKYVKKIITNPKLYKLFREFIRLLKKTPAFTSRIEILPRILVDIFRGIDLGIDILPPVTAVTRIGTVSISSSVAKALSHGFLSGASLAFDVVSLFSASADIYDGSKCPRAEEIRTANKKLKEEMDIIEDIYETLIAEMVSPESLNIGEY